MGTWIKRGFENWKTGWQVIGRLTLFYFYLVLFCLPLTLLLKFGDIWVFNYLQAPQAHGIFVATKIVIVLICFPFCCQATAKASGYLLKANET